MVVLLAEIVEAPPSRGLRYGLFAAAVGPMDLPVPGGLRGGVQFLPQSCGTASLYPVVCDDTPPAQTFKDGDGYIVAEPFLARATYVCQSVGTSAAELEARVRQRLANGEQSVAEAGMAQALAASAVPVTAADPTNIHSVVGELEQWLYGDGTADYGNVGYLHAPARFSAWATSIGLAIKDGPVWRTHMGTVWIFGGGYPDDGQMYISGTAAVWRAPEASVPPAAQVFDRTTNQYRLVADREYAVAFDCVAAVATFEPDIASS